MIRIRAPRISSSEEFVPLNLLQAFSAYIGSPDLDIFVQTSAKPDAAYHEVHRRLRAEPCATTARLRRAASGVVLAPGPDVLDGMLREPLRYRYSDETLLDAMNAANGLHGAGRFFVMEGASPLVPWSAARNLRPIMGGVDGDAGRVAEAILRHAQVNPIVIAVAHIETFDTHSRNLLAILLDHPEKIAWFLPASSDPLVIRVDASPIESSRHFVVSPRLEPLKQLRLATEGIDPARRREWITNWVESIAFHAFLDDGVIDIDSDEWHVEEPAKSYIAALALMGDFLEENLCRDFLARLGCHLPLSDLCRGGVLDLSGGLVRFASDDCRRYFTRGVPEQTRAALCLLAGSLLEEAGDARAADLYILAGDREKARESLESDGGSPVQSWQATLASLSTVPEDVIRSSTILSRRICRALISAGQYRRAEGFANALEERERELMLALIARRRGAYREALTLLDPPVTPAAPTDFEGLLLTGELLRLTGELEQADACFELCRSVVHEGDQSARLAFEKAMLRIDQGRLPDDDSAKSIPHLESRLKAYTSLIDLDYQSATEHAEAALRIAPDIPAGIDASLDLMNAHFLAGRWDEARYRAREALALVEETEGDRGSGGILFVLAYLCADEGQWKQAREKIERLRRFYSGTRDEARLREVDLIVAHLALADGDSKSARKTAAGLLGDAVPHDIREAAALIVDEANWMEGSLDVLCSTGKTECLELRDWHLTQRSRVAEHVEKGIEGVVWRMIVTSELDPQSSIPELDLSTSSRSHKLRMLRSAIGLANRRRDPAIHLRISDLAEELGCSSVGDSRSIEAPSHAVEVLHHLAAHEFPFGSMKIGGLDWRYASRNRLGAWNQEGTLDPLAYDELERLLAEPSGSWRAATDRCLLFVEGMEQWPASSREAVGNLMTLRAEHHALRNLLAEEERVSIADAPVAAGIVGESPAIREVTEKITRLSRSEAVVCILGESGTGKELVARSIHKQSPRRGRTFTPINCAALPDALVESELFGHVRGAYTGADRDHAGLIESTDGGTLFLDEIGELPLPAQSKLLRFLQEGEYRRVGDTSVRRSDVRIIAATNRQLEKAVDEGRFREDLFYRIHVIEVKVPPLRERGSDIVLLARFFLEQEKERQRTGPEKFNEEVELVFLSHNWPGNVRELQNAVKASFAIAGDSRRIALEHLPERLRGVPVRNASTGSYFEELNRFRKSLVEQSLMSASGNQNQAAKLLGISRQALAYQIRELGILINDPARGRRS
ncbi:MAG TPA: sigma 54-interacting transcriptional regulator [Thermoanaerobaculia bacterium]|nr:sigma 54-interacting transcriptional regulator [Thermoanaerobaculia bacterium]